MIHELRIYHCLSGRLPARVLLRPLVSSLAVESSSPGGVHADGHGHGALDEPLVVVRERRRGDDHVDGGERPEHDDDEHVGG